MIYGLVTGRSLRHTALNPEVRVRVRVS